VENSVGFGRAAAFKALSLGSDLAKVIRTAFGGDLSALCSQRGRWGLFKKIIGKMESSSQQFIGTLGTAFRQAGGHQKGLCL